MSALEDPVADVELGQRKPRRQRRNRSRSRRRQLQSVVGGSEITTEDGGRYFTNSEVDHEPWQLSWGSAVAGGSLDECRFPEIERSDGSRGRGEIVKENTSLELVSEFDVDLENGELEMKVHVSKSKKKRVKRDCRICHLRLIEKNGEQNIDLGCFCKGDLGASHKKCAETWFKIKGNTICEICGAIAMNVIIEQPLINEASIMNMAAIAPSAASFAPMAAVNVDPSSTTLEAQNLCRGRRAINVLLTCLVLALVISWLCHSNMQSKD